MYTCNNCGGPSGVHPPNSNGVHPSLSIPFFSASIEFLSKSHTSTLSAFMESNSKSKKCGLFSISYNTRNHTDNSQYITETYRKQRNPYTNTDTVTKRHKYYTGSASIQQNRWPLQMTKEERVSKTNSDRYVGADPSLLDRYWRGSPKKAKISSIFIKILNCFSINVIYRLFQKSSRSIFLLFFKINCGSFLFSKI